MNNVEARTLSRQARWRRQHRMTGADVSAAEATARSRLADIDVEESVRRLADPQEKPIPYEKARRQLGLADAELGATAK